MDKAEVKNEIKWPLAMPFVLLKYCKMLLPEQAGPVGSAEDPAEILPEPNVTQIHRNSSKATQAGSLKINPTLNSLHGFTLGIKPAAKCKYWKHIP